MSYKYHYTTVTIAVAGLFIGPLLFTQLAQAVGKASIILWSLIGALLCQVWGARMTGTDDYVPFIFSRLLAGMFSAMPTILGPAYIMDILFLHQRGRVFACYEISLLAGVVASPTIGGFIVGTKSWPYTFWWTIGPVGAVSILVFCFLEETGYPRDKDNRAWPTKPKGFIQSRIATFFPGTKIVPRATLRDITITALSPLVLAVAPNVILPGFYAFVAFGFSVMLNIVLTIFLQTPIEVGGYGFSPRQNAAFTFTAWMGIIVAQVVGWLIGDFIPLWASCRFYHGLWRPENRLWNMFIPGIVSPIGLGIFGAGLEYHLHFMVLSLGLFLVVFAATISTPITINYVVECHTTSPNEVAVAMNMYRLAFSIALGFFVFPWQSAVAPGWVFGMAAFFSLLAALLIVVLAWKGKALRRWSPKSLQATEDGEKVALEDTYDSGREV